MIRHEENSRKRLREMGYMDKCWIERLMVKHSMLKNILFKCVEYDTSLLSTLIINPFSHFLLVKHTR